GRVWFSLERDAEATLTQTVVSGAPTGRIGAPRELVLPRGPARPGRFILWGAGWQLWRGHPWLGVGPDNFRLLYGPYAHIANADPRVHSNNMYLEVLIGGGLLAAAAFAWLCSRLVQLTIRLFRSRDPGDVGMAGAGAAAAVLAILVHGVVD